jgi:hypothetical protein
MSDGHFNYLLSKLEKHIQKRTTFLRGSIPNKTKLEITLRFLETGESNKCSISKLVRSVCALNPKNILRMTFRTTISIHVCAGTMSNDSFETVRTNVNASTRSVLYPRHGFEEHGRDLGRTVERNLGPQGQINPSPSRTRY